MNYFDKCVNVESVKKTYRKLAFEFHPDHGGSDSTMKEINNQYHEALKACHGQDSWNSDTKKTHTYNYDREIEQALMVKIQEILSKIRSEDVEVLLIGTWIWVNGDTRQYKDILGKKGLGLRFSGQKKAWYWHNNTKRKYYGKPSGSLQSIANAYGVTSFDSRHEHKKIS